MNFELVPKETKLVLLCSMVMYCCKMGRAAIWRILKVLLLGEEWT